MFNVITKVVYNTRMLKPALFQPRDKLIQTSPPFPIQAKYIYIENLNEIEIYIDMIPHQFQSEHMNMFPLCHLSEQAGLFTIN